MSKARIAITVPKEVLAQAKKAVRARHSSSVSAYFAESARSRGKLDVLEEILDELDAEHGKTSAEADRWAHRVLGR